MMYRLLPAVLSLAIPWTVPTCNYEAGGGESDGSAGRHSGFGGAAAASGASGGATTGASGGSAGSADGGGSGVGGVAGVSSGGVSPSSGGSVAAGAVGGGMAEVGGTTTGGSLDAGGVETGSFTLSVRGLNIFACATPQTVTLTNTSSVPLTWHVSGDLSAMDVTPLGSTVAAGATEPIVFLPKQGVVHQQYSLSIDADIAPSQLIFINGWANGGSVIPPADIDFGNVPVSAGAIGPVIFVPLPGYSSGIIGLVMTSSDSYTFRTSGGAPNYQNAGFGWNITFAPTVAGPQQATITFTDLAGDVCPPNTFIARGVGVAQ